jgi:DNA repair exonuclease SbcCD ATPase subunit
MNKEAKKKVVLDLPVILSDEIWTELHRKRESRQNKSKRNLRYEYLVKDYLACDQCGTTMSARGKWGKREDGSFRGSVTLYYCCPRREHVNGFQCEARRCHPAPRIDTLVFDHLRDVLTAPATLEALQKSDQQLIAPPSLSQFEWSLSEQEKRLRGLEEERETAETKLVKKLLSDAGFSKQTARIDRETKTCEKLIRELKKKIENIQEAMREAPPVDLEPIRQKLLPRLAQLNFDEKRQLVATLVHQIKISPTGEMKVLLRPIIGTSENLRSA